MAKDLIVILDYGSGNVRSAMQAAEKALEVAGIEAYVKISAAPDDIASASHLILPGQGAFGDCMRNLKASGALEALEDAVLQKATPFLGICVGMQLLAHTGFEHGQHKGLGWLDAEVHPIDTQDGDLKVPHMGWNTLAFHKDSPLCEGLSDGVHFYFVHSYRMVLAADSALISSAEYGASIPAIVGRDNIYGTQFHPEKSGEDGIRLLSNFLRL